MELPCGAVIAVTSLVDCVPTGAVARELSDQERAFGDYRPGRYAWLLGPVKLLPAPVPARGALGLWDWEPGAA